MKAFVITSVLAASLGLAAPAADVLALADRDIACSSGIYKRLNYSLNC